MKSRLLLILILVIVLVAAVLAVGKQDRQSSSPQAATSTCAVNNCPFEIHDADSGRGFTYTLTSRFTLVLDPRQNPRSSLTLSCTPDDVLGSISNIPAVAPPLYAARYEGVNPGTCRITDSNFNINVTIVR